MPNRCTATMTEETCTAGPAVPTTKTAAQALGDLVTFYRCLFFFLWNKGSLEECPFFQDDKQARVNCYSFAVVLHLFSRPHYRNGSFQEDMVKNLRNVAIPGTGIPLSVFCYYRITVLFMMFVAYPLVSLVAAFKQTDFKLTGAPRHFSEQLLHPQDWFSYWRLNCRLASLHAYQTEDEGYRYEDKWAFLQVGEERGVSVTPWLKTAKLFVKHRNEEGGLGCAAYSNAVQGGDWIIQECLTNGQEVAHLLPEDCPLSTFRVITASDGGLSTVAEGAETVKSLSCVFRAGRSGALTDHSAIFFDVDSTTGDIRPGTTNEHWYQLGLNKIPTCPWTSTHDVTHHPDAKSFSAANPTGQMAGQNLPNIAKILKTATDAHRKLSPGVPLIGWDVAVTSKGTFLLEGNWSCNFFRGSFDKAAYFDFVESYFLDLEANATAAQTMAANHTAPAAATVVVEPVEQAPPKVGEVAEHVRVRAAQGLTRRKAPELATVKEAWAVQTAANPPFPVTPPLTPPATPARCTTPVPTAEQETVAA